MPEESLTLAQEYGLALIQRAEEALNTPELTPTAVHLSLNPQELLHVAL